MGGEEETLDNTRVLCALESINPCILNQNSYYLVCLIVLMYLPF
jgi:hypothetical protein